MARTQAGVSQSLQSAQQGPQHEHQKHRLRQTHQRTKLCSALTRQHINMLMHKHELI